MRAGCGTATTLIKVHYLRPLENAALATPRERLKVFVDDVQLDQEGSEADVVKHFPRAAATVFKMLKGELKVDLRERKG